jgi:hypothetical protein
LKPRIRCSRPDLTCATGRAFCAGGDVRRGKGKTATSSLIAVFPARNTASSSASTGSPSYIVLDGITMGNSIHGSLG